MKQIHPMCAAILFSGLAILTGCPDDTDTMDPVDAADMSTTQEQDAAADLAVTPDQDTPDQATTPEDLGAPPVDMSADLAGPVDMPEDMTSDEDMGAQDMSQEEDMAMYPPVTEAPLGGARPATVVVPTGFDNSREVPLVILLHGYSATGTVQNNYFGLSRLTDDRDFVLVYPDGTRDSQGNQFWNATDACCDAFRTGVDDVAYLRGLIEEASQRFRIDSGRVYLVGHSNGGFMSYRMACEVSEYVTGIFSLAGATYKDTSECDPANPVHVVQMHGTNDTTISYNGGSAYPTAPLYPAAEETVSAWAGYNDCMPGLVSLPVGDVANTSALPMTVQGFEGCDVNGSVELWTIQNGSHVPMLPATFAEVVIDHLFAFDRTP